VPSLALAGVLLVALPAAGHHVVMYTGAELDAAALVARDVDIARSIADDSLEGRNNGTPGSLAAQALLIQQLKLVANGLNSAQTGDDAYKQALPSFPHPGDNLLAVIPGSTLPNEYIMIGAHYDHLGISGADIYNGATDNAAGVAAVLAVGEAINALPTPPERSVILALWDAEEDGLVGSEHFVNNPLVPLSSIETYVNLDIMGANLIPSLRNITFSIAAESGGNPLIFNLIAARGPSTLDVRSFTRAVGMDRSDHRNFLLNNVPSVFLSDGLHGCYHTPDDDASVLDLGKLADQAELAFRIVTQLAQAATPAAIQTTFVFVAYYSDAERLLDIVDLAIAEDLALFPMATQTAILAARDDIAALVAAGSDEFNNGDNAETVALAAAADVFLGALEALPCDGYVIHHVPSAGLPTHAAIVVALLFGAGAFLARRIARTA
jgi:hypothetical protein